VRRAERVVDVEDLLLARLHGRAELIEEGRGKPRGLGLAGRILDTADRRLRGERRTALRAATDGELHERVVAQPVEVGSILLPAGDGEGAFADKLDHLVLHARRLAPIRHGRGEPPADAELALGLPQQQEAGVGGLDAAGKIDCELLALDGWQVEGKRRIVGHGGCGAELIRKAPRPDNDLLRESLTLRHSRQTHAHAWCMIRVRHGLPQSRREHL